MTAGRRPADASCLVEPARRESELSRRRVGRGRSAVIDAPPGSPAASLRSRCALSSWNGRPRAPWSTPMRYVPAGSEAALSTTTARKRRRTRLRSTAVPTLRGTANATRRASSVSCAGKNCTLTGPDQARRLERRSSAKAAATIAPDPIAERRLPRATGTGNACASLSSRCRIVAAGADQADSRTRPRRRRALMTARPARVDMR